MKSDTPEEIISFTCSAGEKYVKVSDAFCCSLSVHILFKICTHHLYNLYILFNVFTFFFFIVQHYNKQFLVIWIYSNGLKRIIFKNYTL